MASVAVPYFEGKQQWALILGGSSGLGLAAARQLAAQGMHLVILHRDRRQRQAELDEEFGLLKTFGTRIIHWNKDALKQETVDECVAGIRNELGGRNSVKVLLHAISKGNLRPLSEGLTESNLVQTASSMAFSLLTWVNALTANELFSPDARIIGLTSEGNKRFLPQYGAVAIAKSALETLIVNLSVELAPKGIRANAIQAGVTDTPSLRRIPDSERILENSRARNPFGKITTPEDVAKVVYLLCTDEAAWINGAIIPVDGGEKNI
jgi:enoyl-[acyl-carrier protein] reductase I